MLDSVTELLKNLLEPENLEKIFAVAIILVVGFAVLNIIKVLIVRQSASAPQRPDPDAGA